MHLLAVLILVSLFALARCQSHAHGALSDNGTLPLHRPGTVEMWLPLPLRVRMRRSIDEVDKFAIVELHNKLRGDVRPPASNMEHMSWDEDLAHSASSWVAQCTWDHGPETLLPSIGQNLAVHWGRPRPPIFHVQAWFDEATDFEFPHPQECKPWCPYNCKGAVCTHYTQLVWATTTKVGCAIKTCVNMNVWGEIWKEAVYLVCNYAPKGNWIGLAPYKRGSQCSQCPPIYGGRCHNNLCYRGDQSITEHSDHKNGKDRNKARKRGQTKASKKVISTNELVQEVTCETRLRDKCKGIKCRRYKCPANCLESNAKVFGSIFFYMFSSICRAAIHHGVLNNGGGLVDVTLQGRKPFFIRSSRHGVDSSSQLKPAKAFSISPMSVQTIDCRKTVAQLCPFEKKITHCPRVYCQPGCRWDDAAQVFGNKVYEDSSSICRAALHAGVITNKKGGYVDIVPLREKKRYASTFQNEVKSERITNPSGGKAFRVFVVS
uniref:cysteine-rich secretory protein LCCL domain-containing 2-like n=1 Tax=Myxine glutinosa TaxID=7769 RepID=UPI00358E69BF